MAASYKLIQQGPSQSYLLNALFSAKQVCSFGLVSPFPCCGYLIVYSKYAYFLRIRHFLAPILIVQFNFFAYFDFCIYTPLKSCRHHWQLLIYSCVCTIYISVVPASTLSHMLPGKISSPLLSYSLLWERNAYRRQRSPFFSCSFREVLS